MILVCPECGCTGDAAAFAADGAYKEALALAVKLPKEVQAQLVPYLGLFRPPKKSLTGPRTLRLVRELAELVGAGTVAHDKQPPRKCPPPLWAQGMREMAERKSGQQAHFSNHNYLRKIVYDLADKADAAREAGVRKAEAKGRSDRSDSSDASDEPLTEEARANRDAFFERVRSLSGKLGMK